MLDATLAQAATLGAIALLREYISDAGITTGYSTYNFALTDGALDPGANPHGIREPFPTGSGSLSLSPHAPV